MRTAGTLPHGEAGKWSEHQCRDALLSGTPLGSDLALWSCRWRVGFLCLGLFFWFVSPELHDLRIGKFTWVAVFKLVGAKSSFGETRAGICQEQLWWFIVNQVHHIHILIFIMSIIFTVLSYILNCLVIKISPNKALIIFSGAFLNL